MQLTVLHKGVHALSLLNPVSRGFDHVFLGEGGMDHTVHLTVLYPIVVNSHAKLCV
jgi:hypothetical protein